MGSLIQFSNMSTESLDNKRIAKNTLLLYFRMLFMMFIGLFTSRVILNALGVSDLGLMTVAGSVILMFTFLNGTLESGTQRFISFAIGEGNKEKLKSTFASAMTMHLALALVIVLLGETIGLWYVYNKLNVPPGRFEAAMWCYQLSILSTFVGIILVPFGSALIAHEKMGMYAYMSIYDASMKLLAAYLIQIIPYDRLIFYSILTFCINLVPTFIYNWYCRAHFEECGFRYSFDKKLFKEMFSFSGWNVFGCLASMGSGTGVNLVINIFCGTVVNGARSIAFQANGWVNKFVQNFLVAINPQVVKSYAEGNVKQMFSVAKNGSKFGAFLVLMLGCPLMIEMQNVLLLWLGQVPEHTVLFTRVAIAESIIRTISRPMVEIIHATGKMKMPNLTSGMVLLMIVPISYLLLANGVNIDYVVIVNLLPWMCEIGFNFYFVSKYTGVNTFEYFPDVFAKLMLLSLISLPLPILFHYIMPEGFLRLCLVFGSSIIVYCVSMLYIGVDSDTRRKIIVNVSKKIGINI